MELYKMIAYDSIIHTSSGDVRIQDAYENRRKKYDILTLDAHGNPIYKPIKDIINPCKRRTYKLETENGNCIKVTLDQNIRVERGWKELPHIHEGDFVVITIDFEIPTLAHFSQAWNRITSIARSNILDVYYLMIDDNDIHHGFINGILVHE